MDFIKEFCPESKTVVIRSRAYGSDVSMFVNMIFRAQQDGLKAYPDNCRVVQYGGQRYARTFGIEFNSDYAPEDYAIISHLEYTK